MFVIIVVGMAMLVYFGLLRPRAAKNFPVRVFESKALVGERERDAQLVLADGNVTVIVDGDTQHPLQSVPFGSVISISYSRGRDPMWKSPKGPARAARTRGALGIFRLERHWITLRTDVDDRFIILWGQRGVG